MLDPDSSEDNSYLGSCALALCLDTPAITWSSQQVHEELPWPEDVPKSGVGETM